MQYISDNMPYDFQALPTDSTRGLKVWGFAFQVAPLVAVVEGLG